MNILFLTSLPLNPFGGGIERVTHLLATQFAAEGHSVAVISSAQSGTQIISDSYPLYQLSDPFAYDDLLGIIKREATEVIITQNISPQTLKLLAKVGPEVKKTCVYHNRPFAFCGFERKIKSITPVKGLQAHFMKALGIIFPTVYGKGRNKYLERLFISATDVCDRLFLLSDRFIPRFFQYAPTISRQKVDAINNPNTFSVPDHIPTDKENLFLYVGRLEDPQKNVWDFIKVWQMFSASHPDWKAEIVGDGPQRKAYERFAKKKGVKNLTFVGARKDTDRFYSRAKILCLTSLYEGWPMVLAEAMAYGCVPAVYDTFEASREIISDGISGIVSTPLKPQELASRISEIADNKGKLSSMAVAANLSVRNYTAANISKIWLQKLSEIIST